MPEYIDRDAFIKRLENEADRSSDIINLLILNGIANIVRDENIAPAADVVEVVRCRDCKFATELDKHCELSRAIYKHCSLMRGEPTDYVWHKYKRYYKNYSLVEADDYCSYGERKDGDNK